MEIPNGMPALETLADEMSRVTSAPDDGTEDIGGIMFQLELASRLGTRYAPPIEKPEPRTVAKSSDDQLMKRVFGFTKKATRIEKIPALIAGGGFWIREFDENDSLFACYFSVDGEANDGELIV
jgi:hypothetical protein